MPLFSFKNHRKLASTPTPSITINPDNTTAVTISRESTRLLPIFGIKYESLDIAKEQIRILQVHRGQKTEVISCTLRTTFLAASTGPCDRYETVSYCWGKLEDTASIRVNGFPVKVTRSAAEVIHRIRSPTEDRVIWIDAICINQSDDLEKGQQVGIMARIYSRGLGNIVWLGRNEYNNEALKEQVCRTIVNIRQHTDNFQTLYKTTHNEREHNIKQDGTFLDPNINLNQLGYIFQKPWFCRLWVVQEAALAQRNICHIGSATFDLKDILRIAVWIVYNTMCTPPGFVELPGLGEAVTLWYLVDRTIVPRQYSINLTSSFFDLRVSLMGFSVTNPHDLVYAMLGLLVMTPEDRQRYQAALQVDYTKDIRHVFADATRAFIGTEGSPDVLQYRSCNVSGQPSLEPSWALDLRHTPDDWPNPAPFRDFYNASNGISMSRHTYDTRDPDILCLNGALIDVVKERTDCMIWDQDQQFLAALNQAFKLLRKVFRGTAQDITIKMACTLMAETDWRGHRRTDANDLAEFNDFQEYIRNHGELPPSHLSHHIWKYDEKTQKAMRCFGCIVRACRLRRAFVTRAGRVGIGPGNLSNNDLIVILHGGSTPYALRQVGKDKYKFLGGCYVYGIMEGEAIREQKAGVRKDVRFDLI